MAELGFFVRELNTGWAEWSGGGLPAHADAHLATGAVRCSCSLHPELVARRPRGAAEPGEPLAP